MKFYSSLVWLQNHNFFLHFLHLLAIGRTVNLRKRGVSWYESPYEIEIGPKRPTSSNSFPTSLLFFFSSNLFLPWNAYLYLVRLCCRRGWLGHTQTDIVGSDGDWYLIFLLVTVISAPAQSSNAAASMMAQQ